MAGTSSLVKQPIPEHLPDEKCDPEENLEPELKDCEPIISRNFFFNSSGTSALDKHSIPEHLPEEELEPKLKYDKES